MDRTIKILEEAFYREDIKDVLLCDTFTKIKEEELHALLSETLLYIITEMEDYDLINSCMVFTNSDHQPQFSSDVGEWVSEFTSIYTIDQALPLMKEATNIPYWNMDIKMYEEFLATLHLFLWKSMVCEVLAFYSNNRRKVQLKEAFSEIRVHHSQ